MNTSVYPFAKAELEELLAWIEFGAKNHPDQEARSSAEFLAKELRSKINSM